MANMKQKITYALDIQEADEGLTHNINMLRRFLDGIKTQSQWLAFVRTKHQRYGKLSYEVRHYYYCTTELVNIMS